jgi:riboflavin kinase/FMN adenylyltransferase
MVRLHFLEFDCDLYGKTLSTDLLERLRPDERFDSLKESVAQMEIDKAAARAALARSEDATSARG